MTMALPFATDNVIAVSSLVVREAGVTGKAMDGASLTPLVTRMSNCVVPSTRLFCKGLAAMSKMQSGSSGLFSIMMLYRASAGNTVSDVKIAALVLAL